MKDWRGTEIEPGDTVVYPGTRSSTCWVTEAEVLAVESGKDQYGRSIETVRVRPLRRNTGWTPHNLQDRPNGVLLKVPNRATVVQKAGEDDN